MTNEPTAAELIEKLGGAHAVATMCEVTRQAVHQWARDGIPRARMLHLMAARPELFPPPEDPILEVAGTVGVEETRAYVLAPGVGIAFVKLP